MAPLAPRWQVRRPSVEMSEVLVAATRDLLSVAGPKLLRVRSVRDVQALLRDDQLIRALSRDLAPFIDACIATAIEHPLPVRQGWRSHGAVTVTSAVGAGAGTSAELAAVLAPASTGLSLPTALTLQVAAFAAELYVEMSAAVHELEQRGIRDPAVVREMLLETLVPDAGDVTKQLLVRAVDRLARRLVLRIAAQWLPVVGIVTAATASNLDLYRVRRAATRVAVPDPEVVAPGPSAALS